MKSAPFENVSS